MKKKLLETQGETNKNILNISTNLKNISELILKDKEEHNKNYTNENRNNNKIKNNKARNKNKQKSKKKIINDSNKEIVLNEDTKNLKKR